MTLAFDCTSHYWAGFAQGLAVGVLTTLAAAIAEIRSTRRRRASVLDFGGKESSR